MDREALEARAAEILQRLDNPIEGDNIDALVTESDEVRSEIEAYEAKVKKADEARARLSATSFARTTPALPDAEPEVLDTRSVAERFVESRDLADYREHRVGRGGRGGIQLEGVEARALISTTTSAPLGTNQRLPGTVSVLQPRPFLLADMVTTIPVTGNAIEYVRDNSATPQGAAAEVAEGTIKPESTYTWEVVSETIKTVAHWMDITRQALEDYAQLQGLARERLFYGLAYRVDAQLLNGTGLLGTMRGVLNTTGINVYAPIAAEAQVISLRKAKTLVQQDEFDATVAVLNPLNWEAIELSVDAQGAWRVTQNPQNALSPQIWGMTVVATNAIAAGTALIGDFRLGATLYDRRQASLYVTDSDADKFRFNILTFLAEIRLGFGVNRPSAFAKITFNGSV